jgi:Ca-activated chloride channel family protein
MNLKKREAQFLDYLEDRLSADEKSAFLHDLDSNVELQKSFESYSRLITLEDVIRGFQQQSQKDLSQKVLAQVSHDRRIARYLKCLSQQVTEFYMRYFKTPKFTLGGVATVSLLILCVRLGVEINPSEIALQYNQEKNIITEKLNEVALEEIETKLPTSAVTSAQESAKAPSSTADDMQANEMFTHIPEGYKAVTIPIEVTSAIEGWARPGSRVDLSKISSKSGKPTISIVTEKALVLKADRADRSEKGINSDTSPTNSNLTVLIPRNDASMLELAQSQGKIIVSLSNDRDEGSGYKDVIFDDLSSSELVRGEVDNVEGLVRYSTGEGQKELMIINGKLASRNPDRQPAGITAFPMPDYGRFDTRCRASSCSNTYVQSATETAQYNQYQENVFIDVAQEAMSTFSIDVDTASYSNARRFLQAGRLPPQDAIRVEEFINYFDYSYPTHNEKPFTASYEIAPSPLKPDRYLLKLGVKARDPRPSETPWNLVFLVDVSGSMQPDNRLPLVKKALRILVERMRPYDRIALVTYAGVACNPLSSTSGTEKKKILAAIDQLGAGGSTNGSGGIELAYDIAERNVVKGGVNRVILATDGDFNVGVNSQHDLIKLIEEKRKSGVSLTTIGVGDDNLHDGTLEQLADHGDGNYFYLDTLREARKVMEDDLTKNMEVVAKDVKLQLEFNPKHVKQYRLVGYDNRTLAKEEFNNDKIDAGEIGPGHTVTAIYELVLADSNVSLSDTVSYRYQKSAPTPQRINEGDQSTSNELAFLKIRYKEPTGTDSKLLQYALETAKVQKDLDRVSSDFKFAAAVTYFAELLRHSRYAGSMTYRQIAELAQKSRGEDPLGYRQEFIELVKNAAALTPVSNASGG